MKTEMNAQDDKVGGIRTLSILALTLVALAGGAYLSFGDAGAKIVKALLQARETLAQANPPMSPQSRQFLPCTLQATQAPWSMVSFWMSQA